MSVRSSLEPHEALQRSALRSFYPDRIAVFALTAGDRGVLVG